jgi:hypothetical protein
LRSLVAFRVAALHRRGLKCALIHPSPTTLSRQQLKEEVMVSRIGSVALLVFAIAFASVLAGAHQGRGKDDDAKGKKDAGRSAHEGRGTDDDDGKDEARIR